MLVKRKKEIDAFVQKTINSKPNTEKWFSAAVIERLQSAERAEKGLEYLKQNLLKSLLLKSKKGNQKSSIVRLNGTSVEANKKYGFSQKARSIISKASTKKNTPLILE